MYSRAHFYLRNISNARHLLDRRTTAILVHVYDTVRLNNSSALIFGLPETLLSRLQRVQNAAARLVSQSTRLRHAGLTWTALAAGQSEGGLQGTTILTYKALHGLASQYLADLLSWYRPTRPPWSSDSLLLTVPRSRLQTFGVRASAVPRLWNTLPAAIRASTTLSTFRNLPI